MVGVVVPHPKLWESQSKQAAGGLFGNTMAEYVQKATDYAKWVSPAE